MSEQWIPKVGDRFVAVNYPVIDAKMPVFTCIRRSRNKKPDGSFQVWIWADGQDKSFPLQCVQPVEFDRPFDEVELKTLLNMVSESIAASQAVELVQSLECLSAAQKRQLWGELTPEVKQILIEARRSAQGGAQ